MFSKYKEKTKCFKNSKITKYKGKQIYFLNLSEKM